MNLPAQTSSTPFSDLADVAATYAEFAADPRHGRAIEGIPAELAARLPGFVEFGIDGELLVEAIRAAGRERGPATPGWAEAISAYGARAAALGEAAQAGARPREAERRFLEASFWYFLARFPHILNPAGARAYQAHREAYAKALALSEFPGALVEIPFGDKKAPAWLRLPAHAATQPPVVILWGGIDVWKSDQEIHSQSEALLRRGVATLALDMPGTGEAPAPVSTTAESLHRAALGFLRGESRVDGARIGAYGLSFGGYFAVKLALLEPALAGVVEVGGPIHLAFQPANLARLPLGTKIAMARVLGLDPLGDPARLGHALAALSLSAQGLLPAKAQAPLLSINGDLDELVPIAELNYLRDQGVAQDRLQFADDRHVASRNWRLHEAFAADWLANRLGVASAPCSRRGTPQ